MHFLGLPEKIETQRLVLQRLRYEDAEEIFYAYASKPEVTKYLSWRTHESINETRTFLQYAIDTWNRGMDYSYSVRLKESNQLIGGFGFVNDPGKVQFGYAFSPAHWNQGYATEVCKKAMTLIRDLPEVYRVGTFVDTGNIASVRVLEKCGLVKEATLMGWFRFVNQDNQPRDCSLYHLPLARGKNNKK
jgi:[ribosomal protein S5]-alanine N-acetyltransferase